MINDLIIHLVAIKEFAKDIHYSVHGDDFYGKHLFADRLTNEIDDFIDSLKENALLGQDLRPLPSTEYLKNAIILIPDVNLKDDKANFENMLNLIKRTSLIINREEAFTRGVNKLLDDIDEVLANDIGLLNLLLEG